MLFRSGVLPEEGSPPPSSTPDFKSTRSRPGATGRLLFCAFAAPCFFTALNLSVLLAVDQRQDLRAARRVLLEDPAQRAGHHDAAGLLGATDRHARVRRFDHARGADRVQ